MLNFFESSMGGEMKKLFSSKVFLGVLISNMLFLIEISVRSTWSELLFEFLREQAHLRIRTSTFSSVMRVRSNLAYAIHSFFNEKGFYYVNTPIITSSDAEGAGEMFKVSTLDLKNIEKNEKGEIDYSKDFFGKKTNHKI